MKKIVKEIWLDKIAHKRRINPVKKIVKEILNDSGYGVVELLIILAAIGLLATTIFGGLEISLTGEKGATAKVGNKIIENIEEWGVVTGSEKDGGN